MDNRIEDVKNEDRVEADVSTPGEAKSDRRAFLTGALAAVPAVAFLAGCGSGDKAFASEAELGSSAEALRHDDCGLSVSEHERARRRKLTAAHVGEENEHDIDGLMDTFALHAEVTVNGTSVTDRDYIRAGHVEGGFSHAPGSLEDLRVIPLFEYFTDDHVVYEGLLTGKHVAPMAGFPPTFREVSINYVAFYRFDRAGKLVQERLTFNHGVLAPPPPAV